MTGEGYCHNKVQDLSHLIEPTVGGGVKIFHLSRNAFVDVNHFPLIKTCDPDLIKLLLNLLSSMLISI